MIPVVILAVITVTAIPPVNMTTRTMVNTFVANIPNLTLTTDAPEQPSMLIMITIVKTTRPEETTTLRPLVIFPVVATNTMLALPTKAINVVTIILETPETRVTHEAPETHEVPEAPEVLAVPEAPVTHQVPEVPVVMEIPMVDEILMNAILIQCQVFLVSIIILLNLYFCLKPTPIAPLISSNVCSIPPIRK